MRIYFSNIFNNLQFFEKPNKYNLENIIFGRLFTLWKNLMVLLQELQTLYYGLRLDDASFF